MLLCFFHGSLWIRTVGILLTFCWISGSASVLTVFEAETVSAAEVASMALKIRLNLGENSLFLLVQSGCFILFDAPNVMTQRGLQQGSSPLSEIFGGNHKAKRKTNWLIFIGQKAII